MVVAEVRRADPTLGAPKEQTRLLNFLALAYSEVGCVQAAVICIPEKRFFRPELSSEVL